MSDSTSAPVFEKNGYVRGYKSPDGRTELWHKGGVSWFDAPMPRRFHVCRIQTYGFVDWFTRVDRCACGAIKDGTSHIWSEKNARRRD